jgi:predicted nucleotidyltransferase
MRKNQDNAKTLEWLYENTYYDSTSKKMEKYKDYKGTCKAVHQYMTIMSLVQYHNDE